MSNIVRMLRALPIYVTTGKTEKWSTNAAGYFPCQDTGTRNDSYNAGGALTVTQITDITGLVAWKDYIPVMEFSGGTAPFTIDGVGYIPVKKSSGSIFSAAAEAWSATLKGADITLSNSNFTASSGGQSGDWCLTDGYRTTGLLYFEILLGAVNSDFFYAGICSSATVAENGGVGGATDAMWKRDGAWSLGGGTSPAAFITGDVLGFACDFTTRKIRAFKNNVEQGLSAAWAAGNKRIGATNTFGASPNVATIRTATSGFSYAPPSGYIAWADGS